MPVCPADHLNDLEGPVGDRQLILARADQHVVWRGDAIPDRPERLIDTLRGKPPGSQGASAT